MHPNLTISELELVCFDQKWLIKIRRCDLGCDPGKSRSLSGRWEQLHFSNLQIDAISF